MNQKRRRNMRTIVFCKTTAKETQTFFIKAGGKVYFLFEQNFKKSNKDFFSKGVSIDSIGDYSNAHSYSVKKTLDKLPQYIRYIEKEYNISIYKRTKNKTNKQYKRKSEISRWDNLFWETA